MKLSFYIAGEKTAVSASFGCRFPLVLLLSTTSKCLAASGSWDVQKDTESGESQC